MKKNKKDPKNYTNKYIVHRYWQYGNLSDTITGFTLYMEHPVVIG